MSYPEDEEILQLLPATCPELAASFFPGYIGTWRWSGAVKRFNARMHSMEKYRMVRRIGVSDTRKGAVIWDVMA